VAGDDTWLVSGERVVVWRSLSQQGLRCGGDSHCFSLGATLFCVYDSLIEKCSTVSGSERQRGSAQAFYSLSLASEWNEGVDTH
jgi:hypothetical protein